jgi:hypothetical protein
VSSKTKTVKNFVKPTISIPVELEAFVVKRKSEPQHAGNLSSYIRSLIIADRESQSSKPLAA